MQGFAIVPLVRHAANATNPADALLVRYQVLTPPLVMACQLLQSARKLFMRLAAQ